jgi:hypothetical protein
MATYYWVGGSGTWSGTGNTQFAITSGGVPTALNPTSADTVNFDANSGTAATVTVAATAVSLNTTVNKSDINLSLSGNPTLCTSAGTLTLTAGTITLNTFTLTAGIFSSSNSNTRAIAFGTGNITLTGNATTIWNLAILGGMTYTGSKSVNCSYSGSTGTRTVFNGTTSGGSEATAINLNITAGSDIITTSIGYFNNINFTGFSGTSSNNARTIYGNMVCSSSMTWTAGTSVTTFASTSGTQQITTNGLTLDFPITVGTGTSTNTLQLQDALTMGSTRLLTLTSGTLDLNSKTLTLGSFNSNNSNTRTLAFGTASMNITQSGTTIFNTATTTGFTITGTRTVNFTYSGSTGTRTIQGWGSAANANLYAFNFNITAGSDIINIGNGYYQNNLNFTGFSGTLSNGTQSIYGNVIGSSGMTWTAGTNVWTFSGTSGTQQITTNGKTLDFPLTFNGIGGTFAFQDALTQGSTRAFTITNGTVQLQAGVTSTVGSFATSGTNMKYLQSTTAGTQATISQASGLVSTSYLTIQDSNATGGATWQAFYFNSDINAGNNTGWDFLLQAGQYIYTRRKNRVILS